MDEAFQTERDKFSSFNSVLKKNEESAEDEKKKEEEEKRRKEEEEKKKQPEIQVNIHKNYL